MVRVNPLTDLANRSHQNHSHSPFSSLGASMSTIKSRGGCHQHVRNAVLLYQPFTLLHIPDLLIPDRPGHLSSFRRRRHLNSCKHARRQNVNKVFVRFPPSTIIKTLLLDHHQSFVYVSVNTFVISLPLSYLIPRCPFSSSNATFIVIQGKSMRQSVTTFVKK